MTAIQNCLNRHLFFPNLWGSFVFDLNGRLQYIRVVIIIVSFGSYAFCICKQEALPPKTEFMFYILIIQNYLICLGTLMLLRACFLKKHFMKSLELMENVYGFVNCSEIKLIIWPSIVSNIVIFAAVSYKAYKFSNPLLYYFSNLHILLLLNGFTDEFSTILFLLRFLSDALNTHLANITNRENFVSALKAHDMLCSAVHHINKLYSLQILIVMALSFFCSISFTNLLIYEFLLAHIDSASVFLWVTTFLQMSVKIILAASSLSNSIGSFDVQIYEILKTRPPSWTQVMKVEDLLFDRTVTLTAAGFFDLTIENLGSMISIATTYLVLLIQMD